MELNALRKKYPVFEYQKYSWNVSGNDLFVSFSFKAGEHSFNPEVRIKDVNKKAVFSLVKKSIDSLVFNLGLIESLSYWKAFCSPEIKVEAGNLSKDQISWFKDLIFKGMGQYFFENKIDWRSKDFIAIVPNSQKELFKSSGIKLKDRILIGVGGGKDSAVSLELLKKSGKELKAFSLNPIPSSLEIINISGLSSITIERKIDSKLLELNRKGFLNGHTPFSAYLAFLSVFLGYIFDCKYLALSNERSSNEGNVKYLGEEINHQYSKTFEFEKKFRKYSKKYLAKDIEYFSFLRPLYELQIGAVFSKYPQYFSSFLSCNEAQKTGSGTRVPTQKWCRACSKCLFAYIILNPFLKEEEMISIFGKNLLKDPKLIPLLEELDGMKRFKPFECVGTKKEVISALLMKQEDSPLMEYFRNNIKDKGDDKILKSFDKNNFLTKDLEKILKDEIKSIKE